MVESHSPRGRSSQSGRRVAVSGLGWLCAAGGPGATRALSVAPADAPAPLHDPRAEGIPVAAAPLYTVEPELLDGVLEGIPRGDLPDDAELRLSAAAASLAVEDAKAGGLLSRAGLVLTYEAPGMDRLLRGLFRDLVAVGEPPRSSPEEVFERFFGAHREAAYATQSFLHLHNLAKVLALHGPTLFINNACASGLHALDAAARMVSEGQTEMAIAVAAECPRFPAKRLWFAEGGLHSTDGRVRPFDRDRTGLILGEGSAAFVLETLDGARARGVDARWEYLGSAFHQEGWKVTIPNFAESYHEQAIRGACDAAGLEPGEVDVIVAHGAGTTLSDAYEAKGITSVFGDWPERPLITALKGWIGHTLGACALLEAALALSCLDAGFVPAALGFKTPDPRLRLRLLDHSVASQARTVLKVANGFAGFNAAALFERLSS